MLAIAEWEGVEIQKKDLEESVFVSEPWYLGVMPERPELPSTRVLGKCMIEMDVMKEL